MSHEKKPDLIKPAEFRVDVMVGDPVIWLEGGDPASPPAYGIVTKRGHGSQVSINLIEPNNMGMRIKEGCKHRDDPNIRPDERLDNGTWYLHPRVSQAQDLAAKVESLLAQLGGK